MSQIRDMSAQTGLSQASQRVQAIFVLMAVLSDKSERPASVVMYTRKGCHLCDDALVTLTNHGVLPTLVDIDADLPLQKQFGHCVPVVEIDGRVRFWGRVSPILLRRLLRRRVDGN